MARPVRLCLAGEGAQGFSHFASLSETPGVGVVTLCGGVAADAQRFAEERGIPHWSLDLAECLQQVSSCAVLYILRRGGSSACVYIGQMPPQSARG